MKVPYVFPIVGGRKVEQLYSNIEALDVALTEEHIKRIQNAAPFDPGFPMNMMGDGTDYGFGWKMTAHCDMWPARQAIRPTN
ncbi:hypothetical protein L226DRAFT_569958 [Lentinus tigrinus ALCF2SS1-7]|uniref:NADP-dependent oxidoreductase domain-containing protein n=1 Tax=Lentinus tigrinus ALCF2SS1-6 TaxID=1328759 RepID=A0A5C2RM67_9APHY|nr:hypothetical protein L227DRAFT_617644 [Lentinus tigrinus ALCF2SS1-6]RPD76742.1 hypothetical protein L226DRAFT_569958 [Lentinus tigrinus ALCF2SS1-7]